MIAEEDRIRVYVEEIMTSRGSEMANYTISLVIKNLDAILEDAQ